MADGHCRMIVTTSKVSIHGINGGVCGVNLAVASYPGPSHPELSVGVGGALLGEAWY